MRGWATLPSFNLPGSGPSYPLSTPGVRVALKPNDKWNLMVGVYNGDPAERTVPAIRKFAMMTDSSSRSTRPH
jgi:hypothetical protein